MYKKKRSIFNYVSLIVFGLSIVVCVTLLILTMRGIKGNPEVTELRAQNWTEEGPFELSPERGRFALMYSIVENNSFIFSTDIARFATPDLGYKNGNFVSLFAPGVSYLIAPGYLLGKEFGFSQVGAYMVIGLFAILNVLLIRAIGISFGVSKIASTIAGVIFLAATPALPYASSLYQHHISTFLILLACYLLVKWNNILSLFLIILLCGLSIPIDYPNLFLMFPIGVAVGLRIIQMYPDSGKLNIRLNLFKVVSLLGIIPPLLFFLWFNQVSYGNPFQFSGTVERIHALDQEGEPIRFGDQGVILAPEDANQVAQENKSALGFFEARGLVNGLYTHLISPDRGILYYTPVMFVGIIGLYLLYRTKNNLVNILLAILLINLLLYSMWGDPWGGWAFGSRYMIPGYAILSIGIAAFLDRFKKNILFIILFFVLTVYSLSINVLGAITTNRLPPQVEVLGIEKLSGKEEKFTPERNWDYLQTGGIKSFSYKTYFSEDLDPVGYYYRVLALPSIYLFILLAILMFERRNLDAK